MAEGADKNQNGDEDFAAKPGGDDRSMGEILASIRKIVTDEERARKETEEMHMGGPAMGAGTDGGGADILVLDAGMRVSAERPGAGGEDDSPPLDLGLAALRARPVGETADRGRLARPGGSSHTPSSEGLSEDEVVALVRRVVREELKGPIGQQISRKVKALVAEEVRRAQGDDGLL